MDDHEAYEVRATEAECNISSFLSSAGRPDDRALEERTLPVQSIGGTLFGTFILFVKHYHD